MQMSVGAKAIRGAGLRASISPVCHPEVTKDPVALGCRSVEASRVYLLKWHLRTARVLLIALQTR